jgi:hypothetical protein
VITRRNVNLGNNVQVGQSLMAIRSPRDIWIDANFKETQHRNLRIGQHVDLEVDLPPSGVSAILALIVVGALLGRGLDARWLIAAGLLILAAGNFWMSQLNLDVSPWQAVWPRVVMIAGLGMIFAPLNVAAYLCIPRTLRGAAVGLFAHCAMRAAASALRWARPSLSAAR